MYTALMLARAAGYTIHRVPNGGAVAYGMRLEVGPVSTDDEILALADQFIELPDASEIARQPTCSARVA